RTLFHEETRRLYAPVRARVVAPANAKGKAAARERMIIEIGAAKQHGRVGTAQNSPGGRAAGRYQGNPQRLVFDPPEEVFGIAPDHELLVRLLRRHADVRGLRWTPVGRIAVGIGPVRRAGTIHDGRAGIAPGSGRGGFTGPVGRGSRRRIGG